ncbi:hypothetical protein BK010_07365 [Tenericutes bacterium MO-XQ]|nr:hypothetical protein BK010_07365 [Tenericutes bacterium MO-XQ]
MKLEEVLVLLEQNANASRKKTLLKAGAKEPLFGVPLGFLRTLAQKVGINHELALSLWNSKNTDARFLAVMLFDPNKLNAKTVDQMIDDVSFDQLLDDLIFRCVYLSPEKEVLEKLWYKAKEDHKRRAAWSLIVKKIGDKNLATSDYLNQLLEVIEKELVSATPLTQWMTNRALSEIGFRYLDYTERCLSIGEKLGVYKDMMVAPGCTSAYAPDWIHAVLKRGK